MILWGLRGIWTLEMAVFGRFGGVAVLEWRLE